MILPVFFNDKAYLKLAFQCADTLQNNWRQWDAGFWTYYDLYSTKRLASIMYQKLHVREFRALARIFRNHEFRSVAERWEQMLNSRICRMRWAAAKVVEKVRLGMFSR